MKPKILSHPLTRMLTALALGSACVSAAALQVPGPLVETGWLADHQGEVVILDVRKDAASFLGQPPKGGKPALGKLAGHIPGAVSVPWKKLVVKASEQGAELRSMLPKAEAFAELMQASGVSNDSAVVVAGRGRTAKDQAIAARLYFTLKYFGHDNVALLNGGTAQWATEGRPIAHTQETVERGGFSVTETRDHLIADTPAVAQAAEAGGPQLVDCRTEDMYLGLSFKRRFVSPEHKGHLAGAETLPFVLLADNTGPAKLFPAEQVAAVARLKGIDLQAPIITYCNTGTTASLGWFALHELLGNQETRLYDGSMHAWGRLAPSDALVSIADAEQAVAEAESEPQQPVSALQVPPAAPPRSLQTLVDERRDALRRRREALFDAVSGRYLYHSPATAAFERMSDSYRDARRAAQRRYRDAVREHQEAMRDFYAPWTRPYHERAQIRHFLAQMRQLDRREILDGLDFARMHAPW